MQKFIITIFILLALQSAYSQPIVFEDDFESYVTGTHPDSNWITRFSGQSSEVSEDVSNSGIKSFKLVSTPGWVRVEAHELMTVPDNFIYEGYVYVNQSDKGARIGFGKTTSSSTYKAYNQVSFANDGKIYFVGSDSTVELQSWSQQNWYKVKVYGDFSTLKGKVWIDDVLKAENINLTSRNEFIDFFVMGVNWSGSGTSTAYFDDIILAENIPTVINSGENIINDFQLYQNYPNPFNPSTTILYQIPELSFITLKVYDVLGEEIATLFNEEKPAGTYEIEFNAENLPSGIYFYRIQAGNYVATRKMLLLK